MPLDDGPVEYTDDEEPENPDGRFRQKPENLFEPATFLTRFGCGLLFGGLPGGVTGINIRKIPFVFLFDTGAVPILHSSPK